jgi:hypothetical protein
MNSEMSLGGVPGEGMTIGAAIRLAMDPVCSLSLSLSLSLEGLPWEVHLGCVGRIGS